MKNNKQQTAVEWFIEQLEEKGDLRETTSIRNIQLNIDTTEYLDLKRQAKEMEKEQKKFMFNCGRQYQLTGEGTFTEVYNETYGGNNE